MRKLNNKGMTTVEILLCFVLVAIITVSMYTTISSYNNKQNLEANKEKIVTYKNLLTREIQSDIIKRGLIEATFKEDADPGEEDTMTTIDMKFRDGSVRQLFILKKAGADHDFDFENEGCSTVISSRNDQFSISYGDPTSSGVMEEYPLPDLGDSLNDCDKVIKDLRINNVYVNTDNHVLSVYIGLYHPELSTRYGIDIVAPINYSPVSASGSM